VKIVMLFLLLLVKVSHTESGFAKVNQGNEPSTPAFVVKWLQINLHRSAFDYLADIKLSRKGIPQPEFAEANRKPPWLAIFMQKGSAIAVPHGATPS
jgi:hypothetical protein